MDCSLSGSSVHGILQARILEWVEPFPSPRHLPDPGIKPGSTCITGRFFTIWAIREAQHIFNFEAVHYSFRATGGPFSGHNTQLSKPRSRSQISSDLALEGTSDVTMPASVNPVLIWTVCPVGVDPVSASFWCWALSHTRQCCKQSLQDNCSYSFLLQKKKLLKITDTSFPSHSASSAHWSYPGQV